MSLTLGLTGMDPATEAALKAAFLEANARLGERWSLVADSEAEHVVVDMDSMYGPMSWLRLHAAGRQVIGLTSAPRTQTDFRLGRPFDPAQLMTLLADLARRSGTELQADAGASAATPAPGASAGTIAEPARQPAAGAPALAQEPPADKPELDATPQAGTTPPPAREEPAGPPDASPGTERVSSPASVPAPTLAEPTLASRIRAGAIDGRVRFRSTGGITLLIDGKADVWHGPLSLKAVAPAFEGVAGDGAMVPVDDATWSHEAAAAGAAQPLARLRWLGGLLAGKGQLLPGVDADGRFQLNKWPQTEREYPRHFRIATQMMRGPATLAEIAEASGVPVADVADFVNANLATGFAEPVVETPAPVEEPPRQRGGLLGRLRNR